MKHPYVSIIIPVYNGANTIKESLDSLLNQDYIEKNFNSVEIIIINDNHIHFFVEYYNRSKPDPINNRTAIA